MRLTKTTKHFAAIAGVALLLMTIGTNQAGASPSGGGTTGGGGGGTTGGGGGGGKSLKTVAIPGPADLATYVKDKGTLVALGKALFWDMQVGNDGMRRQFADVDLERGLAVHAERGRIHQQVDPRQQFADPLP